MGLTAVFLLGDSESKKNPYFGVVHLLGWHEEEGGFQLKKTPSGIRR